MFFNIGPLELVVLAFVAVMVIGPDRLPALTRDAARLLRSLREMATGARTQLREELGPEFADLNLRSLNPRTVITQALLGDDIAAGTSPSNVLKRALLGDPGESGDASSSAGPDIKPVSRPTATPLGRNEAVPYDSDAT